MKIIANSSNSTLETKMESPKSSPRRLQDSSGTLKTKISLGKNPTIVHSGPFYLLKELPEKETLTGATNLINHYGLEHTYSKFNSKKVKEQLSSFLPTLPCVIDGPGIIVSQEKLSFINNP
jgi:mediator of RNA polymerase II transcription subunit 19